MPASKQNSRETIKELLTVREVAAALGVTPQRVYQKINAGELPSIRTGSKNGGVRVPRQAFEAYLHELTQLSVQTPKAGAMEAMQNLTAGMAALLAPWAENMTRREEYSKNMLMYLQNNAPRH